MKGHDSLTALSDLYFFAFDGDLVKGYTDHRLSFTGVKLPNHSGAHHRSTRDQSYERKSTE
jgi:hypothetical protein